MLSMSTLESDILPSLASHSTELGVGAWLPILSIGSQVGYNLPISVSVAGEKLVAWENPKKKEWSVMRNACPHRQASLLQGRVDPASGCIECLYHGQQLNTTGACTKIPQSDTKIKLVHLFLFKRPMIFFGHSFHYQKGKLFIIPIFLRKFCQR
jgi:nitrite reductase/ring-hydroxylating ferredoxin subunit